MLKRSLSRRGQDVEEDTSIQPLEWHRHASVEWNGRFSFRELHNDRLIDTGFIDSRTALLNQPTDDCDAVDLNTVGISRRPSHATRPPRFLFSVLRLPARSWPSTAESDKIVALTGRREPRPFVPQNRTVDFLWGYGIVRDATGCASIYTAPCILRAFSTWRSWVWAGLFASRFPRDKIIFFGGRIQPDTDRVATRHLLLFGVFFHTINMFF